MTPSASAVRILLSLAEKIVSVSDLRDDRAMRVPAELATAFGAEFERELGAFLTEKELIVSPEEIGNERFLRRSIVPHVEKLSEMFNRLGEHRPEDAAYWKRSANPKNLRLAYLLSFMPCHLMRVASAWAELGRLGFRYPGDPARARVLEIGAGPATGACGIAAGERFGGIGLPPTVEVALMDQDRMSLELGAAWVSRFTASLGLTGWEQPKTFMRRIELKEGFLPRSAPKFDVIVMSYFLNEFSEPASEVARALHELCARHLSDEGALVIVDSALKAVSRKLLEVRAEILERPGLQVLTPCLGHQACGALAAPEDWCHDVAVWWRPPYLRTLDTLSGLDRKALPLSHLVLSRSKRPLAELLSGLRGPAERRFRLVSPARKEGPFQRFYVCGQEGKFAGRTRDKRELERGDLWEETPPSTESSELEFKHKP
jgi:hypothetical protein